jgi:hypothetical protein
VRGDDESFEGLDVLDTADGAVGIEWRGGEGIRLIAMDRKPAHAVSSIKGATPTGA